MKKINILVIIFSLVIGFSCSNNRQTKELEISNPCMPGFILIVYNGENSAPVPAVLMRTDEKDSTYYKRFVGDSRDMFLKNDFVISESWEKDIMRKFIINENDYSIAKRYIIEHNTHKSKVEKIEDYSCAYPFKIILSDQCDSIVYIVDNRDIGYFKHLLDSTAVFNDKKLQYSLDYFRRIQDNK